MSFKSKYFEEAGWPADSLRALGKDAAAEYERGGMDEALVGAALESVRSAPERFFEAPERAVRKLAREVARREEVERVRAETERVRAEAAIHDALSPEPLPYAEWGSDGIEDVARRQMDTSMRLPITVGGALMPDAHVAYGLPVGGVLATRGAVVPWAVGVDIACRLRLSVYPVSADALESGAERDALTDALVRSTNFGQGGKFKEGRRAQHEVMDDERWGATKFLRGLKDTAAAQLGSSGTGNHFVEWGTFVYDADSMPLPEESDAGDETGVYGSLSALEPGTRYLAALSHSGSRGVGAKIADRYSKLAEGLHPFLEGEAQRLAWLDLDQEAGAEYWLSMELAGAYAAANHDVIHAKMARALGENSAFSVEHHHNYAWMETWRGEDVVVHRKGATPAGRGVVGIVPGTMADPGYVTVGKGVAESLNSASHGAGRAMSRNKAEATIDRAAWRADLEAKGITLIGGAVDEAPAAYKNIREVMARQTDLVDVAGVFEPSIVRMADAEGDARGGKRKGRKQQRTQGKRQLASDAAEQ